jgi:hypothetical protein
MAREERFREPPRRHGQAMRRSVAVPAVPAGTGANQARGPGMTGGRSGDGRRVVYAVNRCRDADVEARRDRLVSRHVSHLHLPLQPGHLHVSANPTGCSRAEPPCANLRMPTKPSSAGVPDWKICRRNHTRPNATTCSGQGPGESAEAPHGTRKSSGSTTTLA